MTLCFCHVILSLPYLSIFLSVYFRKLKQLQQAQTIVTNTIICTNCGGAGHLSKDCKQSRPGDTFRNMIQENTDKAKMDSEVNKNNI